MELSDLKAEMDGRFEQVDQRFDQLERRFAAESERIRQHVEAEGEKTRRYFDVVAEQMKAERNLSLDQSKAASDGVARLSASNAAEHSAFAQRLDDHERRLRQLEEN